MLGAANDLVSSVSKSRNFCVGFVITSASIPVFCVLCFIDRLYVCTKCTMTYDVPITYS